LTPDLDPPSPSIHDDLLDERAVGGGELPL
jgi:hypothetical protein